MQPMLTDGEALGGILLELLELSAQEERVARIRRACRRIHARSTRVVVAKAAEMLAAWVGEQSESAGRRRARWWALGRKGRNSEKMPSCARPD